MIHVKGEYVRTTATDDGSSVLFGIHPTTFKPLSAVTATSEVTAWTPTTGKRFRLMSLLLTASATGSITLRDNTAGTVIAIIPVTLGVPTWFDFGAHGILSGAINRPLTMQLSVAGNVSGTLGGAEE